MSGHWNYHLSVETIDDEEIWAVRAIHYDEDGVVRYWSQDPAAATGDTWAACFGNLAQMSTAAGNIIWDLDAKCWVDRHRDPVPAPDPADA